MAVIPGPPIILAGPGVYAVPYPGGGNTPQGSHQWTTLKLENASSYALTVYLDSSAVYSLPAGVADVFPLSAGPSGPGPATAGVGASPAQLISIAVTTPTPTAQVGYVRPSFGQYGDVFPGTYPIALPTWGVTVQTTDPLPASTHQLFTVACPSGSITQVLAAPPAGDTWEIVHADYGVTVVTTATGAVYWTGPGGAGRLGYSVYATGTYPVNSALPLGAPWYNPSSLSLFNSTGVSVDANVLARPIALLP